MMIKKSNPFKFTCNFWSEQDNRKLLVLKGKGYSAAEIASMMGKTRNAILGRLWRIKRAAQ